MKCVTLADLERLAVVMEQENMTWAARLIQQATEELRLHRRRVRPQPERAP